jgi:hypothetical protein
VAFDKKKATQYPLSTLRMLNPLSLTDLVASGSPTIHELAWFGGYKRVFQD